MEDSLEAYLRLSKQTPSKKQKDQQENIKRALITQQMKKQSQDRAMKIVEFMMEGRLKEEFFYHCLLHINQEYYQDIVEERALNKICGYPLCAQQVPDMPKKQFHISFRSNKVYDITDRKNFCSNFCYNASLYIKNQIDTTPLWLRTNDKIPCFKLLSPDSNAPPGEEIDHGIAKPDDDTHFTSINVFTEVSLSELVENDVQRQKYNKEKVGKKTGMQTIPEVEIPDTQNKSSNEENEIRYKEEKQKVEPKQATKTEIVYSKEKSSPKDILDRIHKCIFDWTTIDTLIFLHSQPKLQEIFTRNNLNDVFESLKLTCEKEQQQTKYLELCRKIHLNELAEERFDNSILGKEMKPLPDYEKLKEEGKSLDLKVKSFYQGISYELEENKNVNKDSIKGLKERENQIDNEEEEPPAFLPLTDSHSQTALRRRIFLNSLRKVFQNLEELFRFSMYNIQSDIQGLVKTFKLKPDNVVFKPLLWKMIGIVILKILSIKNNYLREIMESSDSQRHIRQIFKPFPASDEFLNGIILKLNDVESFVTDFLNK